MGATHTADLIVSVSGIVLTLAGLAFALLIGLLEQGTKRFFIAFFGITLAYASAILTRTLIQYEVGPEWAAVSRIVFFAQALLSSTLTVLLTGLLLYQSGETRWWRRREQSERRQRWQGTVEIRLLRAMTARLQATPMAPQGAKRRSQARHVRGQQHPLCRRATTLLLVSRFRSSSPLASLSLWG